MKLKPRKPIYAFLILIPLTALFAFVLFTVRNNTLDRRKSLQNDQKFTAVERTLTELGADMNEAEIRYRTRLKNLMELMPLLLNEYMEDGVYKGPEIFKDAGTTDGFVVRVKDGSVIYPDTGEKLPDLDAASIMDEVFLSEISFSVGEQDEEKYLISSRIISGDYYYVDLTRMSEMVETVQKTTRFHSTLEEIGNGYDCRLLLIKNAVSGENQEKNAEQLTEPERAPEFIYQSESFSNRDSSDTLDTIRKSLAEKPSRMTIDGQNYQSAFQQIFILNENVTAVILMPLTNEYVNIINSVTLTVMLTLIITIPMIMWLYWCQKYVCDHELLPEQANTYHPSRLREMVVPFGLIGAVIVFLSALCFQSLSNLNMEMIANQNALKELMGRLTAMESGGKSDYEINEEEWYVYYAERIAGVISEKMSLQTPELLGKINDLAGSEYIMVFDSQGEEIACSSGVIGYSISNTDVLSEFQPVLSGAPTVITVPVTDPVFKKDMQYIGTRIPLMNEGKKPVYGLLLLAVDAEKAWQEAETREINDFLENLVPERNLFIVIDKFANRVAFSSEKDLYGQMIPDLMYTEGSIENSDLDSFTINGKHYYGSFRSNDDYVGYYLTEDSYIRISSFTFSVISVLGYAVILSVICLYMLTPYTPEAYQAAVRLKTAAEQHADSDGGEESDFIPDLFMQSGNWIAIRRQHDWNEMLPEQKLGAFARFFFGIIVILLLLLQLRLNLHVNRSTINFVLNGNWKRGLNLLGWSAAFMVVIGFAVFSFVKDILKNVFCSVNDPRIATIFRLFFSLVQYIAVIYSIFLILGYLGFNTTMQLTSVGILSLAISMGSQTLVADILSGIFIIFEGEFHVGDIIEINGFRGVVQEIGVRSTKLLGLGNNIKIISNSNIKDVLNLTKMNAWFTLEFDIAPDQSLPDIEEMLKRELPGLKNTVPEIVAGPYYKGVWSIGHAKYTLSIACECDPKETRQVQRELSRAVIMLFDKYHFKLA